MTGKDACPTSPSLFAFSSWQARVCTLNHVPKLGVLDLLTKDSIHQHGRKIKEKKHNGGNQGSGHQGVGDSPKSLKSFNVERL